MSHINSWRHPGAGIGLWLIRARYGYAVFMMYLKILLTIQNNYLYAPLLKAISLAFFLPFLTLFSIVYKNMVCFQAEKIRCTTTDKCRGVPERLTD